MGVWDFFSAFSRPTNGIGDKWGLLYVRNASAPCTLIWWDCQTLRFADERFGWAPKRSLPRTNGPLFLLPFLSLSSSEQCIYVAHAAPRHARNVLNGPSPQNRMLKPGPKLVQQPKSDRGPQSSALTELHLWGYVTHFYGSPQITCHMFCVCFFVFFWVCCCCRED